MASPDQSSSTADPSLRRPPENAPYVLAAHAVNAMADKKAKDITVIDLREISNMADFFVIATGESDLQVRAIADGVMERLDEECGEQPWKREGMEHLRWVLLDYVDVVMHVLLPERREHYRIERLWGEADRETVPEDGDGSDVELLQNLMASSDEDE
ncbi:MAG: ribosome silencing factor [Bacteroidetes bacterium SW_9_63_38]|nr:MAG: ribosome silencing factor [Bacteroidetes bacterium SW_9_63_38]